MRNFDIVACNSMREINRNIKKMKVTGCRGPGPIKAYLMRSNLRIPNTHTLIQKHTSTDVDINFSTFRVVP